MRYFPYLCFAVFAGWSLSVAAGDLAARKIPNSKISLGVRLLLAVLLALAVNSWLGSRGLSPSSLTARFYGYWAAHVCWAAAAGAALWYSEVWPAGDAKFFMVTAAWLPLIDPLLKNFPHYLFLVLLVNIFVTAALAAVLGFLVSGLRKEGPAGFFRELYGDIKERLSGLGAETARGKWRAAAAAVNLGFLFLLQQTASLEARGLLGRFLGRADLLYFFLFFLWDKLSDALRGKKWLIATGVCYAAYLFAGWFYFYDHLADLLLRSFLNLFRFGALLFFGRSLLAFLMEKKDSVFLGPGEIEPGMILSEKASRAAKADPVFEGAFDDCFKDGLSPEQAGLLRDWLRKLPDPDAKIEIVAGRPFAAWIFAGALLTLLSGSTVFRLMGI